MAIAVAMVMGCLPRNSLAAPNEKSSSANEDNSLASKKPESVGGAEKRSKKMSNLDKASYGFAAVEVIWETIGWFSKIPTPGKGIAKAVEWIFSSNKPTLKKKIKKIKEIKTVDELREAIKDFAANKKSNTTEEQKQIYKKIFKSLYEQYKNDRGKLFRKFHENDENKFCKLGFGFKVISSNGNYWLNNGEKQDDKCVFIVKPGVVVDDTIRNILVENPQWKVLCDAATKLKQEIVIGIGLHEYRNGIAYMYRNLEGYINIGLKGDESCFEDNGFSIFDFTFYDQGKNINNLNELDNLK